MKRRLVSIVLALLLIFTAGCGEKPQNAPDNPPAALPPEWTVGTWKTQIKPGHAGYLEIFADGMAGLYLGDDESDQLYEIYEGTAAHIGSSGTGILMFMDFELSWYIYEGEITDVPDSYKGSFTFYPDDQEDNILHVFANDDANDGLFGQTELTMLRVYKTRSGGSMADA